MADSPLGVKSRGGASDSPQVSRTRFDCHDAVDYADDQNDDDDDDECNNYDNNDEDEDDKADVKVWSNNSSTSACD